MRASLSTLLVLALALFVLGSCGGSSGSGESGEAGTQVVSSVYPLTFVASRVAGDSAEVVDLTPGGQEPHDIELSSDQIVAISGADLLLYVGGDFQPAVEDVVPEVGGEAVDVLEEVALIESEGDSDPHVWLDPDRLIDIAAVTAERLGSIDPESAEVYEKNADSLAAQLKELDAAYSDGLSDCERNELVTAHEAFGYLADRYDLEQVGIAGIDPEAEPSPQRLVEVADFVRQNDVQTIFFEELVSPAVAETIADETGADTASLDPLESPPETGDYITEMRENLSLLKEALGCR